MEMTDLVDNASALAEDMIHPEDNLLDDPDKIQLESIIEQQKPSLEPPLRDSAPTSAILGSPSKTRPASVVSVKNTRKRMEDRHVLLHDLKAYLPSSLQSKIDSKENVSYYAVFDGHAGTDAASYAAAHLHEMLVDSPNYPDNPGEAFTDAFLICDEKFVSTSKKSGTTAICCLIKDDKIFVSWLGDSQAVLVRNGQTIKIVDPHKPNREDEKERIEKLGGTIMHWGTWRVNGQLAVSRAIGDGEYKPYISAQPDITTINMNGTEDFIIIACDGLWDTISFEEATELTHQFMSDSDNDLENLSVHLSTAAKDKGSTDNITIIVIFLKPVDEVKKTMTEGYQCGDGSGIASSSQYVLIGGGGRDSIDQMRVPSPGLNFASPDGGGMFSPFDHQGAQNGFDLSNENFDNRLSDEQNKRFSEENVANTDDLMKKKSIEKVNDLLAVLNCGNSSPTPEDDEDRPLDEILATARDRTEDDIDGVENGDSSDDDSDDEEEGVLRRKPSQDPIKIKFNGTTDPTMDPCEQVTVVATGPDECGTVVPPSEEMPVHQQPESVELAPEIMSCSMVQEENVGVSFDMNGEKDDGTGFMLKTPGNGEEQLSEFTPDIDYDNKISAEDVNKEHKEANSDDWRDPGVSVEIPCVVVSTDTVEATEHSAVEESDLVDVVGTSDVIANHQGSVLHDNNSSSQETSSGLDIPCLQVTPATPVRSLTPVDKNIVTTIDGDHDIINGDNENESDDKEVDKPSEEVAVTVINSKVEVEYKENPAVDGNVMSRITPSEDVVPDTEESVVGSALSVPTITTTPATPTPKVPTSTRQNEEQKAITEIDNNGVEHKESPDIDENEGHKSESPTNGVSVPKTEESAAVSVPTITTTPATPTPKKPPSLKQINNEPSSAEVPVKNKSTTISKRPITTKTAEFPSADKPSSSRGTNKSATSSKTGATRSDVTKEPVGAKLNGATSGTKLIGATSGAKLNGATTGQVSAKKAATTTSDEKSQVGTSKNPIKRAPLTKPTAGNERTKISKTSSIPTIPKTITNPRPPTSSTIGKSIAGVTKPTSTRPIVARTASSASSTTGSKRPTATGSTRPTPSGSSTGSTRPTVGPSSGITKSGASSRPSSGPGSRPVPNKTSVGTSALGTNRTTVSKTLPTTKASTSFSRATTTRPTTTRPTTTTRSTTSIKTSATTSSAAGTKDTTTTAAGNRGTASSTTAGKPTAAASRVAAARAAAKEASKQGKQTGKVESKGKKDQVNNEVKNGNVEQETNNTFETVQSHVDDLTNEGKEVMETEIEVTSMTGEETLSGEETNTGENTCALNEKESEC